MLPALHSSIDDQYCLHYPTPVGVDALLVLVAAPSAHPFCVPIEGYVKRTYFWPLFIWSGACPGTFHFTSLAETFKATVSMLIVRIKDSKKCYVFDFDQYRATPCTCVARLLYSNFEFWLEATVYIHQSQPTKDTEYQ